MAKFRYAKQLIIPPGANDPRIKPRVGILHVDATNQASLYNYFNGPSNGIESHFHIPKIGRMEQYRDTDYEADANHKANPFALSFETQGFEHEPWNDKQLLDIKESMFWAYEVHGIPLKEIETWDGEGWGYHTLFGAPGPWTPVSKSCPGPLRKKQFHEILVPWMKDAERFMFTDTDRKKLNDLSTEVAALKKAVESNNKRNYTRFKKLKDLILSTK